MSYPSSSSSSVPPLKRLLQSIARRPENSLCADCRFKGPTWASFNLGVFICMNCSGVHRMLGTHITRVRSVDLDNWDDASVKLMADTGNEKANAYFEAKLPQQARERITFTSDDAARTQFIRNKYERRLWFGAPSAAAAGEPAREMTKEERRAARQAARRNADNGQQTQTQTQAQAPIAVQPAAAPAPAAEPIISFSSPSAPSSAASNAGRPSAAAVAASLMNNSAQRLATARTPTAAPLHRSHSQPAAASVDLFAGMSQPHTHQQHQHQQHAQSHHHTGAAPVTPQPEAKSAVVRQARQHAASPWVTKEDFKQSETAQQQTPVKAAAQADSLLDFGGLTIAPAAASSSPSDMFSGLNLSAEPAKRRSFNRITVESPAQSASSFYSSMAAQPAQPAQPTSAASGIDFFGASSVPPSVEPFSAPPATDAESVFSFLNSQQQETDASPTAAAVAAAPARRVLTDDLFADLPSVDAASPAVSLDTQNNTQSGNFFNGATPQCQGYGGQANGNPAMFNVPTGQPAAFNPYGQPQLSSPGQPFNALNGQPLAYPAFPQAPVGGDAFSSGQGVMNNVANPSFNYGQQPVYGAPVAHYQQNQFAAPQPQYSMQGQPQYQTQPPQPQSNYPGQSYPMAPQQAAYNAPSYPHTPSPMGFAPSVPDFAAPALSPTASAPSPVPIPIASPVPASIPASSPFSSLSPFSSSPATPDMFSGLTVDPSPPFSAPAPAPVVAHSAASTTSAPASSFSPSVGVDAGDDAFAFIDNDAGQSSAFGFM